MTALSMGAFGAYRLQYSKYLKDQEEQMRKESQEPETVWVTKRYIPTDLRTTAPVPRHKLFAPKQLPQPEQHWVPPTDPPLKGFERKSLPIIFKSHPSTRSEQYSTLRQMLPSNGSYGTFGPPRWGTGNGVPVVYESRPPRRFPMINSPMTMYVDEMHTTNKLFKLH